MDDPIRWTTRSLLFFNSAQEDPERLRTFLRDRIVDLRESHRVCLREIVAGANALLDDLEREQAEEAVRQAWRPLAVWLDNDASLTGKPAAHVQDSLLRREDGPRGDNPPVMLRDELAQGHHLVRQALRAMDEGFDGLVRKVRARAYSDDLGTDAECSCAQERGDGYRNKVNRHNASWFEADPGKDADLRAVDRVSLEWTKAVAGGEGADA